MQRSSVGIYTRVRCLFADQHLSTATVDVSSLPLRSRFFGGRSQYHARDIYRDRCQLVRIGPSDGVGARSGWLSLLSDCNRISAIVRPIGGHPFS